MGDRLPGRQTAFESTDRAAVDAARAAAGWPANATIWFMAQLLVSLPALAQETPLPSKTDFANDERWRWRQVDDLTGRQEFEFGRRARVDDDKVFFLRNGKEISLEQEFVTTSAPTADPDRPWKVWPLKIGSGWRYAAAWTSGDGKPGSLTQTATVVAVEDVQVPAGAFTAYKIEYNGVWEVRGYQQIRFSGWQTDTYWYAPSINADVKHVRRVSGTYGKVSFTQELISHTNGPSR